MLSEKAGLGGFSARLRGTRTKPGGERHARYRDVQARHLRSVRLCSFAGLLHRRKHRFTVRCPLSGGKERRQGELLVRARAAIAARDQPSALQLLREMAEGGILAETLAPAVGDALVATARGTKQDTADRAALTRLKIVEETRDQVIELLEWTPFGRADLAVIREVVAALEASAGQADEQAAREEVVGADWAPTRRVGSVWLEMKYIRDAASGKAYGPYLYGRWRDSGRKRSKYIGRAAS